VILWLLDTNKAKVLFKNHLVQRLSQADAQTLFLDKNLSVWLVLKYTFVVA